MMRLAPVVLMLVITGCTTMLWEPVQVAETDAQKAFALYATADAVLVTAADVAEDPNTPASIKTAIKQFAPVVGNLAFVLRDAARAYVAIRSRFDDGDPGVSTGDVTASLNIMLAAFKNAGPSIEALTNIVKN